MHKASLIYERVVEVDERVRVMGLEKKDAVSESSASRPEAL